MTIKTDDRSYERDEVTQALLNTDATALAHSRNARKRAASMRQVERDVVELRKQLAALTARVDSLTSAP